MADSDFTPSNKGLNVVQLEEVCCNVNKANAIAISMMSAGEDTGGDPRILAETISDYLMKAQRIMEGESHE